MYVLLFLLAIIDTCPIVSEVLHMGGVSSSQPHEEGILQMKSVKLRDTQPASERTDTYSKVLRFKLFLCTRNKHVHCHVHLFFTDICLLTEKKVHGQSKENTFYGRTYLRSCLRMITVSTVPPVTLALLNLSLLLTPKRK